MTTPLEIKPGCFYLSCDGYKYRVYAVFAHEVHGAVMIGGHWMSEARNPQNPNLIEEWIDRPEVNWPAMPAWAVAIAKDSDGSWWCYFEKPELRERWFGCHPDCYTKIPPEFAPAFTGDWRNSLVERPSGDTKAQAWRDAASKLPTTEAK